jgi:hypothetical protein
LDERLEVYCQALVPPASKRAVIQVAVEKYRDQVAPPKKKEVRA